MVVYTLAFFAHAYETAMSVRNPEAAEKSEGNLLTKTLDFTKTEKDRKSTRLNSSHSQQSRMPSSA